MLEVLSVLLVRMGYQFVYVHQASLSYINPQAFKTRLSFLQLFMERRNQFGLCAFAVKFFGLFNETAMGRTPPAVLQPARLLLGSSKII